MSFWSNSFMPLANSPAKRRRTLLGGAPGFPSEPTGVIKDTVAPIFKPSFFISSLPTMTFGI